MKDLQQIQNEVGEWSVAQFGDNTSKQTGLPMFSQNALTGLVEEIGELNHVTICRHQGRRGYDPGTPDGRAKYKADRDDALADALIFMCDYAYRENTSLIHLLNQTWDKVVSKRTVQNWEKHSHDGSTVSEAIMKEECSQEQRDVLLFEEAIESGWTVDTANCLHLVGDKSEQWAAEWRVILLATGSRVQIPHWLERRMKEIKLEVKAIEETYAGAVREIEPPNKPEGEGWQFGKPDVDGDIEYQAHDDKEIKGVATGYSVGVGWGYNTWWRVKPKEEYKITLNEVLEMKKMVEEAPKSFTERRLELEAQRGVPSNDESNALSALVEANPALLEEMGFQCPQCFPPAIYHNPCMPQNGVGFAEPVERVDVGKLVDDKIAYDNKYQCPLDPPIAGGYTGETKPKQTYPAEKEVGNNYTRKCTRCNLPVHDSNNTYPLVCAPCYKPPVFC